MQAARAQVGERVEVVTSRAFSARASCATSPASSPPVSPLPSTDTWPEVLWIFYLTILECQMFVTDIITDQRYLHSSGWLDTLVPTLQRFNSHLKRSGQHWSWLLLLSVSMHDRCLVSIMVLSWLQHIRESNWNNKNQSICRILFYVSTTAPIQPRVTFNRGEEALSLSHALRGKRRDDTPW